MRTHLLLSWNSSPGRRSAEALAVGSKLGLS
jgi:hypothetical protein